MRNCLKKTSLGRGLLSGANPAALVVCFGGGIGSSGAFLPDFRVFS